MRLVPKPSLMASTTASSNTRVCITTCGTNGPHGSLGWQTDANTYLSMDSNCRREYAGRLRSSIQDIRPAWIQSLQRSARHFRDPRYHRKLPEACCGPSGSWPRLQQSQCSHGHRIRASHLRQGKRTRQSTEYPNSTPRSSIFEGWKGSPRGPRPQYLEHNPHRGLDQPVCEVSL